MALTTAAVVAAGASAYSSTRKPKTKSKFKEDPFIRDASMGAIDRAKQIADRPYTPFTGPRVAGLSGNERQASSLAGSMGQRIEPFRSRLSGGFSQGALAQFENPYLDRVLNNQNRVIGEEYGRKSADLARNQSAMDAFRTGRSDLARSRLDKYRMEALGDAEAEGRRGAFDTALDAYFKQQGVDLGAIGAITNADSSQIGALSQTGLAERGVEQAGLDFNYGQFLENRDWDVNNLQPLLTAIQAARGDSERTGVGAAQDNSVGAYGGLVATLLSGGLMKMPGTGTSSGTNYKGGM